jgi:hypothetical protein
MFFVWAKYIRPGILRCTCECSASEHEDRVYRYISTDLNRLVLSKGKSWPNVGSWSTTVRFWIVTHLFLIPCRCPAEYTWPLCV